MFSLEILYAVLQGLPPEYLTFLDEVWVIFCRRIHWELERGVDPLTALKSVLKAIPDSQKEKIRSALAQAKPAMHLRGLTYGQREVLIALRYCKVASLIRLSRLVARDISNTNRRLSALVGKGLAFKFYAKEGPCYLAIPAPMDRGIRTAIHRVIFEQLAELEPGSAR